MAARYEENGRVHIDWELDGVTPRMIDWFWSNMEKGFALWHPIEHTDFYWEIKPRCDKFLGAIHVAPQRWSDGTLIEPHIRYEDPATLPQDVADLIVYDHCVAVAGICLFKKDYKPDNLVVAYRIHQWQASDLGVIGRSSAVPMQPEPLETAKERGIAWAKHATEEVNYWGDFLPQLYRLFSVVKSPELNPFFPLKLKREGKAVRYAVL